MNFGTIWGGTSLAKATTKVAEAKTKLREATDAGTVPARFKRRFFGHHYT